MIAPVVAITLNVKLVPAKAPTKTFIDDVATPPGEDIVTGSGTKMTATPEGTLLFVSATLPVKPPRLVIVRVSDAEDPAGIESEDDTAARLKSDAVATVAP